MSSTSVRTPAEIEELREKLRDNIAAMAQERQRRSTINKVRHPITASTLNNWFKEGKAVIAEFNRNEVTKREGNEHEWMESLATKVSAGHFISYYAGKPDKNGKINPTPENPIVIYEGGHRTRWTDRIFRNLATYHGMTLDVIRDLGLPEAKAIEECIIEMTVAVSTDKAALVAFAKKEYDTVNLKVEGLKAGEIIRTGADETRHRLETKLKSVLKRKLKEKERDAHLEELRALVHGAAGLVNRMDKKKGTLTTTEPLTPEQVAKAEKIIDLVAETEEKIASMPELAVKKLQTRVRGRNLELPIDGTLVYALQDARNDAEREKVVDDWVRFHREFFPDAAKWKETTAFLKTATVERSRYGPGETPFPARWQRVQSLLNPSASVPASVDVPVVEPL